VKPVSEESTPLLPTDVLLTAAAPPAPTTTVRESPGFAAPVVLM
jgi:hypothetical protein